MGPVDPKVGNPGKNTAFHHFSIASICLLLEYNKTSNQLYLSLCMSSDLTSVLDRNVDELSGGELQRFACAVVCVQKADM